MLQIKNIYAFIHQDFDRLFSIRSGREYSHLTPESYWQYMRVREKQQELVKNVIDDEHSALFVLPCALDYFGIADKIQPHELNMLTPYLDNLADLPGALGDRFVLLRNKDFEAVKRNGDYERLFSNKDLLKGIQFSIDPKKAKLIAFGEYEDACVIDYGWAIQRALKIPHKNFRVISEASIAYMSLRRESASDFKSELWNGKERGA